VPADLHRHALQLRDYLELLEELSGLGLFGCRVDPLNADAVL
jgi:hypothetical protein